MSEEHKLTTRVPKDLHKRVKVKAAQEETTISHIIRQFLRQWVAEPKKNKD